jgi:predicted dithiol-disulfide oxidoreductase (DUF899 family)
MGWNVPWYSSYGSDFNYDFHVTLDEAVAPMEYNYWEEPPGRSDSPFMGWLRHHDRYETS